MDSDTVVYTAESQVRNIRQVFRDMATGLKSSGYMAYRLCVKDISAENSRSVLGMIWDLLDPLVLGAIFYFLAKVRVINPGELGMPYAVFVIYGLLLYFTFSESVTMSLNVMQRSKQLLSHLRVPPEALILSVFFRVMFNSSFRVIVMLTFSLVHHNQTLGDGISAFSAFGFLKFLMLYPAIILVGMSIGIFLAPFNAIYADVGRFVKLVLLPLRYATPVLYAIPQSFPFSLINMVNPVGPVLTSLRSLATSNTIEDLNGLAIRCVGFAIVFLAGWFVFHISIPVLAERA